MNVSIVYYSMYGHIYRMAEAVKEGAGSVSGANVRICRVPETLPEDVLKKMDALKQQKAQATGLLPSRGRMVSGCPAKTNSMPRDSRASMLPRSQPNLCGEGENRSPPTRYYPGGIAQSLPPG
jgi:hypothetical protein